MECRAEGAMTDGGSSRVDREVVRYRCPHCKSKLKAPLEFAGVAVTCPVCSKLVTVPEAPDGIGPGTEEIPVADEDKVRYRCPACTKKLKVRPDLVGQEVTCPKCGEKSTVPKPVRRPLGETVKARCKTCNGKFKFSRRHAGKHVACPKCGSKMFIPNPDAPDETSEVDDDTRTVTTSNETKPCPYCTADIPVGFERCPYCDTWINRRREIPLEETQDLLLERDYANNRMVGKNKKKCPFCQQLVPRTARTCPICENPLVRRSS